MQSIDLTAFDQHDFAQLTESHRYELQVHCYRMLGNVQDAEDMVQETFLRAWRRRETYAGRASLRAWLYKIATNACLDALSSRQRRVIPRTHQAASTLDEPIPPDVVEPIWLEPAPDDWLILGDTDPESHVSTRESVSLAFIAALHLLPPRQRAVLILRDVLEWQASEAAELLDITVPAVKSALHRARATLAARDALGLAQPAARDTAFQTRLSEYIRIWEQADIDGLLALLKEDATFSMPPIPAWYQGRAVIGGLVVKTVFGGEARGRWRLLPTRANGQVAFGLYRYHPGQGTYQAYGIQVLTFAQHEIADIITFRVPALFARFDLPPAIVASS
ncbi:MAG: sigma-70 family RNA polymerase sigma factor [Anaerolineae bacterium]|nr:sigma-70 family RNA polymerase sigma factor [Anaerolineae bacterium]